jgi:Transglutaminase-like superfamily
MTTPVIPEGAQRLSWHRQVGPRCAVGVARLLVLLPPTRLQRVLHVMSRGTSPVGYADALRARQSAVAVSARCAGLGCLQRSVATVLLCRAWGRWADWCTGFRVEPFAAHAWVEADGRPVGEPYDMSTFHTVLAVRHQLRDQLHHQGGRS